MPIDDTGCVLRAALPDLTPGAVSIATRARTAGFGPRHIPDDSATQGAINALVKSLAEQRADKGIRVNVVAPGPVWAPLNAAGPGRDDADIAPCGKQTSRGRPAQSEEVAPARVLASNADSSFTFGIVLPVTGGETGGA